jgi:hypothetical protein
MTSYLRANISADVEAVREGAHSLPAAEAPFDKAWKSGVVSLRAKAPMMRLCAHDGRTLARGTQVDVREEAGDLRGR